MSQKTLGSEVLVSLQDIINEHGNLEVYVGDPIDKIAPIHSVGVLIDEVKNTKVIIIK